MPDVFRRTAHLEASTCQEEDGHASFPLLARFEAKDCIGGIAVHEHVTREIVIVVVVARRAGESGFRCTPAVTEEIEVNEKIAGFVWNQYVSLVMRPGGRLGAPLSL